MIVKLLTEHHLGFLSLKGGCRGWSESTLVKCPLLDISCTGSLHNAVAHLLQIIFERRSPSAAQNQPKPAHQAELRLTPPTHVSTIRRTPSPAHMPIGKAN